MSQLLNVGKSYRIHPCLGWLGQLQSYLGVTRGVRLVSYWTMAVCELNELGITVDLTQRLCGDS